MKGNGQRGVAACLFALWLASLAGCKPGSLGPSKQFAQIDAVHAGRVAGVVHLGGTAPKPIEIDMASDPVCAVSSETSGTSMTSDYVVNNGGLANVLIYVQSGLGDKSYAIPRDPVVIDQRGCRFEPHVAAAMVGQAVHFTNSDSTMHNVHLSPTAEGNDAFDISQSAHADPVTRYFESPEMMIPLRCNVHPWMQSYLSIVPNPFFTVTSLDGHYTISGLPPGTYTLTAVHEKLGSKSVTIHVAADQTVQQPFFYSAQ